MTTGGIVFMALSWGLILGLNAFCFYRLAKENGRRRCQ